MSKQEDNTDNKKLKEFLNKSKISDDGSMDDFEKEAQEGFAMLGNEEEAFDLKSSLDAKIYKEVFTEDKKSGKTIWYAAAGLALLIGFSVYFIQNNSVAKSKDLAVHSQTPHTTESNNYQIQKSLNEVSKENENLQFKEAEIPIKSRASEPKSSEEEKESRESIQPGKNEKTISIQSSNDGNASGEAVATAAKPQTTPVLAPVEDEKVMMQPAASSGAVSLGSSKDVTQDDLDKSSFSTTKSDAEISVTEVKKEKVSNSKKRSKNEVQTAAADVNFGTKDASGNSCFYSGGDEGLAKDLKKSLSSKNLSQKFDATLFINENKKVEKVILTNTYELTKTQQKELVDVLKALNKFNLTGVTGKNLAEYTLVYRP